MNRKPNARNWARAAMTLLFALVCGMIHAQTTTFIYTAPEKLDRFDEISYFVGATALQSHTFTDGQGTVVYEGTVTELGSEAFTSSALTSVNIPGSIDTISTNIFKNCTELVTVILNEGTKNISFYGCTNLETINFPSTIKEVYIRGNEKLETVTLPEGVEKIKEFSRCTALKQINIPASVTYIGSFYNCKALERVIVEDLASWCTAQHYDGSSYGPQKMAGKLYLGTVDSYEEITDLAIPEGVTKLESSAFSYLTGITSITLPTTLTTWESSVFYGCTGVTDVYCMTNPVTLSWSISNSNKNFKNNKETVMHVMDVDLWQSLFPDANTTYAGDLKQVSYTATAAVSDFSTDMFIGAKAMIANIFDVETGKGSAFFYGNLTAIAAEAFAGNTLLTGITLPDGITTIVSNAFNGCTALVNITLPKSVTTFSDNAFAGLPSATDVWCLAQPSALTWDGTGFKDGKATQMHVLAVDDWTSLFSSANVTFVGDFTCFSYTATVKENSSFYVLAKFTGATDMALHDFDTESGKGTVIFKGVVTGLENKAFSGNKVLTGIIIPDSVTVLGSYVFNNCKNLTTVSLPNAITSMDIYLFDNCTSLATVNIPTSITELPGEMFYGCTSLADITIPENVSRIGASAFGGCTGLTSIYIPASVTEIGSYCFSGCTNLEKVITPSLSVWCTIDFATGKSNPLNLAHHLFIGSKENNTEITEVVIPEDIEEIKDHVFDGLTAMTSLTLPSTLKKIESYGLYGLSQLSDVYCSADPSTLKWQNNSSSDVLMPDKGTKFHVADKAAWETAFPNANVTFVDDLFTQVKAVDNGLQVQEVWYSIDGRRLTDTPTAKGIYIKNGRKFIIR